MFFHLDSVDPLSKARTGVIQTSHGQINTPIFMPVGTVGSVKGVHFRELEKDIQAQIILGNTYHLYLRPGIEVIKGAGGLHQFIGWSRPILTDSGGYQVYSLAGNRKITEEGVLFQSHIDGSRHLFTPEYAMHIQRNIGADIVMAFDECPPYPSERKYAEDSMHLTHRWLKRCIEDMRTHDSLYGYSQYLFPIVQGSTYKDLRRESAEFIASTGMEGNAIGGLSVGEPHEFMYEMTELVCGILPEDKPRYLMGVGTPENLLECIGLGVDMFDCVMPTRNGRNGMLFTTQGILNIRNKKWAEDYEPIDAESPSALSRVHSKAYLRHLFVAEELLAMQIASINNLSVYLWLMSEAREQIKAGTFTGWKEKMKKILMQRL